MAASHDPLQSWLDELGLVRHCPTFHANDIDFALLTDLGDAELRELGLSVADHTRVRNGIAVLTATTQGASSLVLRITVGLAHQHIDQQRHTDARQLLPRTLAADIPQHPQWKTANALLTTLDNSA